MLTRRRSNAQSGSGRTRERPDERPDERRRRGARTQRATPSRQAGDESGRRTHVEGVEEARSCALLKSWIQVLLRAGNIQFVRGMFLQFDIEKKGRVGCNCMPIVQAQNR